MKYIASVYINPFLEGLARIVDFANVLSEPVYGRKEKTDIEALRYDWHKIGQDFRYAIGLFEREQKGK